MLALLTFNKRLGWVVAACVIWSLIGLTIAAGMAPGQRPGRGLPFRLSMGLAQNSIIVDGLVLSIIETREELAITVLTRPDGKQHAYRPGGGVINELPDNLEIVFTTKRENPGASGQRQPHAPGPPRPPGPPEISLLGGARHAKEVAPQRWGVLTENYALKFAPGHLRIIPKPADAKPGWWRKFIQKGPRDQGRPPGPGDGKRPGGGMGPGGGKRPGEGKRPGDGKQPPPPHGEGNGDGKRRPPPPQGR